MARRLTKIPLLNHTVRLSVPDRDLLYEAAKVEGISQSEFLRSAVREKAERVLEERSGK